MSGKFIVLDGVDGAGKSTQLALLVDHLQKRVGPVVTCRDPGSTPLGEHIREILLSAKTGLAIGARAEMLLFMAARAQLVEEIIRPALTANQLVLCDRFLLANVVYQGHAGGLDPNDVWSVGRAATGGLEPDLTIVLDVARDTARARMTGPPDRMEQREESYHERVRQGYLQEARQQPGRIQIVDATLDVDQVQHKLRQCVAAVIQQASDEHASI